MVTALLARRYEVVVLARDPRQARERVPGGIDYIAYRQEQHAADDWTSQLASVDHVVNLAGEPLFRPLTGRRYLRKATRQRIVGTERLVAAMQAAARPRTLINASSVGVYGFGPPADEEVDEDTAPLPGRYATGSAAWEAAAAPAGPRARVVLLRMGYVLTADGGGLPWQLQEARKPPARNGYRGSTSTTWSSSLCALSPRSAGAAPTTSSRLTPSAAASSPTPSPTWSAPPRHGKPRPCSHGCSSEPAPTSCSAAAASYPLGSNMPDTSSGTPPWKTPSAYPQLTTDSPLPVPR